MLAPIILFTFGVNYVTQRAGKRVIVSEENEKQEIKKREVHQTKSSLKQQYILYISLPFIPENLLFKAFIHPFILLLVL